MKAGARIGPYELLAPIGAGGMGEVWKARDTRLDRVVAIKFSHAQFTARFEREARAIAALNHPNIAQIYDVGENYIVMEYVDGEPLRAPDNTRALLDMAMQIADGLAAAHAAGILHRDLKPDNILITKAGRAKILDFGLAKSGTAPAATDATRTSVTDPGSIIGTAAYMSPEQARGLGLDARSDQFSLGLMLYELAAGKRPFQRDSTVETLSAIIRDETPPLPGSIPAPLRWVIERLLSKDPASRYDTTRDLFLELRTIRERLSEATEPVALAPPRQMYRRRMPGVVTAVAAVLLTAAAFIGLASRQQWQPEISAYRFTPFATEESGEYGATWSPDGRSIAYVVKTPRDFRIMLKNADGNAPTVIAKLSIAANAVSPTFVERLAWSVDGNRLYFLLGSVAWSVSRAGGQPEALPVPAGNRTHDIAASPDGKSLAFVRDTKQGEEQIRRIWVESPPGSAPTRLSQSLECCGTSPTIAWSPDSRRILVSERLLGRRSRLLLVEPGRSVRTLTELNSVLQVHLSWLPDNRHAVIASSPGEQGIQLIDTETGRIRPILATSAPVAYPSVSPDGKRIAYTQGLTRFRLIEIPVDGSAPRSFLSSRVNQSELAWSPAGDEYAYIHGDEIRVRNRAGTLERVVVSPRDFGGGRSQWLERPVFSPDGQRIAYGVTTFNGLTGYVSSIGGGTPSPVIPGKNALNTVWSADGSSVMFGSFGASQKPDLQLLPTGMYRYRLGSSESPVKLATSNCNASSSGSSRILCAGQKGMFFMSFDEGKILQQVTSEAVWSAGLSKDEKTIYAIRQKEGRQDFIRVDATSGKIQVLYVFSEPLEFRGPLGGPTRLAVSPDEKSVVVTVRSNEGDIWILDGFEPPSSWWERLWPRKQ